MTFCEKCIHQKVCRMKSCPDKIGERVITHCTSFIHITDVDMVGRGKWVKPSEYSQVVCSRCGKTPKTLFGILPDFCPNCGADMRGKKDEQ